MELTDQQLEHLMRIAMPEQTPEAIGARAHSYIFAFNFVHHYQRAERHMPPAVEYALEASLSLSEDSEDEEDDPALLNWRPTSPSYSRPTYSPTCPMYSPTSAIVVEGCVMPPYLGPRPQTPSYSPTSTEGPLCPPIPALPDGMKTPPRPASPQPMPNYGSLANYKQGPAPVPNRGSLANYKQGPTPVPNRGSFCKRTPPAAPVRKTIVKKPAKRPTATVMPWDNDNNGGEGSSSGGGMPPSWSMMQNVIDKWEKKAANGEIDETTQTFSCTTTPPADANVVDLDSDSE